MSKKDLVNIFSDRIAKRVNELGFTKGGKQMNNLQGREILAALEGHRSWHALDAELKKTEAAEPSRSNFRNEPVASMVEPAVPTPAARKHRFNIVTPEGRQPFDKPYNLVIGPKAKNPELATAGLQTFHLIEGQLFQKVELEPVESDQASTQQG